MESTLSNMKLMRGKRVRKGVFSDPSALPRSISGGDKSRPAVDPITRRMDGQAASWRRHLVDGLTRVKGYKRLAKRLDQCGRDTGAAGRCWHGLCPSCALVAARWLAWTAPMAFRHLIRDGADHETDSPVRNLGILSIKLTGFVPSDFDQKYLYDNVSESLHELLDKAGVNMALGMFNVGGLQNETSSWSTRYVMHVRLIVDRREADLHRLRGEMRKTFGSDRKSRTRPLYLTYPKGQVAGLQKIATPSVSVRNVPPLARRRGQSRRGPKVSTRLMSAEEVVATRRLFSRIEHRLFIHGGRLKRNDRGRVVVRPTRQALHTSRTRPWDAYLADL